MSDLEKFIHNESIHLPELLKIALIHYQFETIHPFLDGNGRIGRLMIPLYLVNKGILQKPVLYISDFFEKNRQLYYDKLTVVREKDSLEPWFKFFLAGVIETSKNGIYTFDGIMQLQKQAEHAIQNLGSRTIKAKSVLDHLFRKPMVTAEKVSDIASISMPSSYKLIAELEKLGILKEVTGGQRRRMYVFDNYVKLFK